MQIVDVPLIWPTSFSTAGPEKDQQRAQAITTLVNFLITVEEAKLTALENSSAGFSAPLFTTEPGQTELDELYAYYAAISEQEAQVLSALDSILALASDGRGQPSLARPAPDWKETLFGIFGYAGNSGARARERILEISKDLNPAEKADAFGFIREGFRGDANNFDEFIDRLVSGELDTQANQIESDLHNSQFFDEKAQAANATVGQVFHQEGAELVVRGGDLEALVIKLSLEAGFPGISKGWDVADNIQKWSQYGLTFYNEGLVSVGTDIAMDTLKDKIKDHIKSDLGGSCSDLNEILLDQIAGQISSDIVDNVAEEIRAGSIPPSTMVAQSTATEEAVENLLPRFSATGAFTEILSGKIRTDPPLGTTFKLVADFTTGSISGTLTGGRSVKDVEIPCYRGNNQSVAVDTANADYSVSLQTAFSGSLDPESGAFSAAISPTGPCSARWVTPFTEDSCVKNQPDIPPGCKPWVGSGTISGYVSKYGWIEFTTQWTVSDGAVQVTGSWSGEGSIEAP
jgi:hypothetical protein